MGMLATMAQMLAGLVVISVIVTLALAITSFIVNTKLINSQKRLSIILFRQSDHLGGVA
jgi:hypothetical protein